jgi:DNA-directed RNA polymerase delta subunit
MIGQKLLDMTAVAKNLLTREKSDLIFQEILKAFQVTYPYKIRWRANNLSRDQKNAH